MLEVTFRFPLRYHHNNEHAETIEVQLTCDGRVFVNLAENQESYVADMDDFIGLGESISKALEFMDANNK